VLLGPARAGPHERTDDRWRRVEDVHPKLLANLPEPIRRRIRGHAFEHERGGPKRQRPIHDIGMARDPTDVRRAPMNVVVREVEDDLARVGGVGQIPAGGVINTLRLARGAGRVEDEKHILGVHGFHGTFAFDIVIGHAVVPPEITTRQHLHRVAGMPQHHAFFHTGAFLERLIGIGLKRDGLTRTDDRIARHQHLGLAVI